MWICGNPYRLGMDWRRTEDFLLTDFPWIQNDFHWFANDCHWLTTDLACISTCLPHTGNANEKLKISLVTDPHSFVIYPCRLTQICKWLASKIFKNLCPVYMVISPTWLFKYLIFGWDGQGCLMDLIDEIPSVDGLFGQSASIQNFKRVWNFASWC